MKRIFLAICTVSFTLTVMAQARVPEATELYKELDKVTPGKNGSAPSDAIVLFDGTNTDSWKKQGKDEPIAWTIEEDAMVVQPKTGYIETKQSFGDVQLHIEWMSPPMEGVEGQAYSNSGVFLMGMYEVQVLNSYDSETYNNGQAGSIYKQHIPLVNATNPPGEWQTYDIIFNKPVFSDKGTLIRPARITVLHNGVLIQNNVAIWGPTEYIGSPLYKAHANKLPLALQDHDNPVYYRNIWIREL